MKILLQIAEVIYQTWETVFHHISKPRKESWKYEAQQRIFDEIQGVWKCDETVSRVLDIKIIFSIETKTKE